MENLRNEIKELRNKTEALFAEEKEKSFKLKEELYNQLLIDLNTIANKVSSIQDVKNESEDFTTYRLNEIIYKDMLLNHSAEHVINYLITDVIRILLQKQSEINVSLSEIKNVCERFTEKIKRYEQ